MLTMKNKKELIKQMRVTTIFGYSLFVVTVVSIFISTVIPFSMLLLNPAVKHANVILLLFVLVAGSLLPPLFGYFAGDRATKTKNKLTHHYNGVLFGIASYWLYYLFSFFGGLVYSQIEKLGFVANQVLNFLPVVLISCILILIAIAYAKKGKAQPSLLHFRPFQIILIVPAITVIAYSAFFVIMSVATNGINSTSVYFAMSSLLPVILLPVSYKILSQRKDAKSTGKSRAVVAVSMGMIAATVFGQTITYITPSYEVYTVLYPIVILVAWVSYVLLVKSK